MRVLLVEDDPTTAKSIEMMLTHANLNVYTTDLGEEGIDLAKLYDYDLIVLDLGLPDMNGHEVLRQLRVSKIETPILILSGSAEVDDKIKGFGFGADDYMVKPFAFIELLARVGMLLGRASQKTSGTAARLAAGELSIDLLSRECFRQGQKIRLTSTEFKLLEYLMRNPKRLVTRTMLLEKVWGLNFDPTTSVVETHISRLRSKIDNPFEHKMIETLRGDGYVFDA